MLLGFLHQAFNLMLNGWIVFLKLITDGRRLTNQCSLLLGIHLVDSGIDGVGNGLKQHLDIINGLLKLLRVFLIVDMPICGNEKIFRDYFERIAATSGGYSDKSTDLYLKLTSFLRVND